MKNHGIVQAFAQKYKLTTAQATTVEAIVNRVDNSERTQGVALNSEEGKRIASIFNKIGYTEVSKELERPVYVSEGELVFGVREEAKQLQEVV